MKYRSILAAYAPDVDPNGLAYPRLTGDDVARRVVGATLPAGPISAQQFTTALKTGQGRPFPAVPGVTMLTATGTAFPQAPMWSAGHDVGADGKLENSVAVKWWYCLGTRRHDGS